MGKLRAKQRKKGGRRPRPTGLPSVKETEQDVGVEPERQATIPVLDKLQSLSSSERVWACHSVLHLLEEVCHQTKLVGAGLVDRAIPLLLDTEVEVRGAAANVLSALCCSDSERVWSPVVTSTTCLSHIAGLLHSAKLALLTPPTTNGTPPTSNGTPPIGNETPPTSNGTAAHGDDGVDSVKEAGLAGGVAHSGRDQVMESEECGEVEKRGKKKRNKKRSKEKGSGKGRQKEPARVSQVVECACQGLQLLGNICDKKSSVLEATSMDGSGQLFHTVLDLMLPLHHHPQVSIAAAQVLLPVLEAESVIAGGCVPRIPEMISGVRELMKENMSGISHLVAATTAGVLCGLYPHVKDDSAASQEVLHVVMTTCASVLDASLSSDMSEKDLVFLLEGQSAIMEVITSMTFVEDSVSECGDMSDGEEIEEDMAVENGYEGMETESEQTEIADSADGAVLDQILQADIHNKVLRVLEYLLTGSSNGDSKLASAEVSRCKDNLLVCSVGVLEHLVVCVPVAMWCGGVDGLISLWTLLLHSCPSSCDPGALSGAMVTILHKLTKDGNKFVPGRELQEMAGLCLTSDLSGVRGDMVCMMGLVGRYQLQYITQDTAMETLTAVGGVLKECVVKEKCLSVVCQALDAIFDIFGDDSCPIELFVTLDLLPVLLTCKSTFTARYKVERRQLQSSLGIVQMVRTNLPRFISYMNSRTTGH